MALVAEAKDMCRIPEGVAVSIGQGGRVAIKGPKGELSRTFHEPGIRIEQVEKGIVVSYAFARRGQRAAVGAIAAHLRNMVDGVTKGHTYRLKTVFSHFPIKTQVKGPVLEIQNFLGERSARSARILPGVQVEVQGDALVITGAELENVSQTAANIELATKIRDRDTRVFQDGIYIVQKGA